MKLKPLGDKVVLKVVESEEKTKGGIILTDNSKEKPLLATVVAVGTGEVIDGKKINMDVKEGDLVIYNKFSGTEVHLDDTDYLIVKQSDILAICE